MGGASVGLNGTSSSSDPVVVDDGVGGTDRVFVAELVLLSVAVGVCECVCVPGAVIVVTVGDGAGVTVEVFDCVRVGIGVLVPVIDAESSLENDALPLGAVGDKVADTSLVSD